MSRKYGTLDGGFWDNKLLRQQPNARLVFCYLLTSKHGNCIGCYYLPTIYACHDLGFSMDDVLSCYQTLSEMGHLVFDEENDWVVLPNYLKFHPLDSPKVAKKYENFIEENLLDKPVALEAILRAIIEIDLPSEKSRFDPEFIKRASSYDTLCDRVSDRVSDTLSIGYGIGLNQEKKRNESDTPLKKNEAPEKAKVSNDFDRVSHTLCDTLYDTLSPQRQRQKQIKKIYKKNPDEEKLETDFEELWVLYGSKQGRKKSFKNFVDVIESGVEYETLKNAVQRFNKYIQETDNEQFKKSLHNFLDPDDCYWQSEWKIKGGQEREPELSEEERELAALSAIDFRYILGQNIDGERKKYKKIFEKYGLKAKNHLEDANFAYRAKRGTAKPWEDFDKFIEEVA